jgi:NADPH-dependent glutamate synthase beta subunit-like oxidoreductase
VAVVGSGPAGFYAAGALLDAETPIEVDMLERLPTPWGLVRLGVAPDHPKLKTVSRAFERIALKPGFRFFGNVDPPVRRGRLRIRRAERSPAGHPRRGSAGLLVGH